MKKFVAYIFLIFLFLLISCDTNTPEFIQYFENISNYAVYVKFYGNQYEIPSKTTKSVSQEIHIADEYNFAEMLENNYPRATMKRTLLSSKSYKYTIENLTGIDCKIVNTSNYEVFISHNYLGENYSEGIYCPKNQTTETKIYKNYNSGFTAIYKNHSTINDTLEADLQNSKCKSVSISQLKDDNNIYLVINIE